MNIPESEKETLQSNRSHEQHIADLQNQLNTGEIEYGPVTADSETTQPPSEEKSSMDYKVDKFKALYQSRLILSMHGTMQERQVCGNQLKRMKKLGIKSI